MSNVALAKAPSNRALQGSIYELTKKNAALKEQLLNQQQTQEQLTQRQQQLEQQLSDLQAQITAQANALQTTQINAQPAENPGSFLWPAVLGLALLLVAGGLLELRRRDKKIVRDSQLQSEAMREKAAVMEREIANLQESAVIQSRQALHIKQAFSEVKEKSESTADQLQDSLIELQDNIKIVQQQKATASAQLAQIMQKPVDAMLTVNEIFSVETLIEDGNLEFADTLKAKAFVAEQSRAWSKALTYWNIYEDEVEHDNEALLHIAYNNYKLAEQDSKHEAYLSRAVTACEAIMSSATEYFEDAYGMDDQMVGPDRLEHNAHELPIYQQVEQLIYKVETLRNYQSIYNLACKFAAQDRVEDARDCLEQVASIFQIPNHEQLMQDEDLTSVRELDWFKKIVRQAHAHKAA